MHRLHSGARRVAVLAAAAALPFALSSGAALASWRVTGTAQAVATAGTLGVPVSPLVTRAGASAVVSWAAAPSPPSSVDGYVVRRFVGLLGAVGVGTVVCQVGPDVRACTDSSPLAGGSSYVVSARRATWETPAAAVTLTPDTTAPTTSATTAPAPNSHGWITTSPVQLTLTATDASAGGGSASGVAGISYRVGSGPVLSQSGATVTVPILQQGSVQVDYWATDAAGNVETAKAVQLKIDSLAPAAPSGLRISSDTGTSVTDLVTSATQQTFIGTAEPGSTVELSYQGSVTNTATTGADGTFRIGPQQVPAGTYAMSIRAVDPAGNASSSVSFTLVVDTTAPVPAVTYPVDAGSYTSTTWGKGCAAAGACGTASDVGSSVTAVSYELRYVTAGTCWNGSGFTTAACTTLRTATGTSSWAIALGYTALKGKTLQLSVYADDLAGNRSAALTRTFQVR